MLTHGVDPHGGMRGIQRREGSHTAGMLSGQPPANRSAPIVPNYGECLLAEAIGESHDIGRKVVEIIVAGAIGLVAEIVASLIGCDDMESTLRERWDFGVRQPYQNSGNPCRRNISGPSGGPASAM